MKVNVSRSDAPEASQGQTRDVPGTPGTFGPDLMCKSILKGQNVPGTDGTYHGTDGTCPRDRRDAHQGVSRQNSLCLLVFFLSPGGGGVPIFIFLMGARILSEL